MGAVSFNRLDQISLISIWISMLQPMKNGKCTRNRIVVLLDFAGWCLRAAMDRISTIPVVPVIATLWDVMPVNEMLWLLHKFYCHCMKHFCCWMNVIAAAGLRVLPPLYDLQGYGALHGVPCGMMHRAAWCTTALPHECYGCCMSTLLVPLLLNCFSIAWIFLYISYRHWCKFIIAAGWYVITVSASAGRHVPCM